MRKTLEEIAQERSKSLLIESFQLAVKSDNVEIFEKPQLIESNGKSVPARGVLRNVPVTRFIKNLNERIYPKKLWEKVEKEEVAEGSLSLMGHPEDEGDPKDICGVWKNFKVLDEVGIADWYLTGSHGSDLIEHIQAGGKIGVSSVGFGEFEDDGKTVKWDTYELERLGDAVINPSQQVFATVENFKENSNKKEENNEFFEKDFTNKKDVIIENNTKEDKKSEVDIMSDYNAKNLKNHIAFVLRESKKNSNLKEAIESLQDLDIPSDMGALKDRVQDQIEALQEKMENEIKDSAKTIEEKDETIKDLQSKYDILENINNEMKEKYQKASAVLEHIGVSEEDDPAKLKEEKEKANEEIKSLKESADKMKEDIEAFEEDTEYRDYDIKCLLEDRDNMLADIKALEEKIEVLEGKKKEQDDEEDKEDKDDDDDKEMKDKDDKKDEEEEDEIVQEKGKKKEDVDKKEGKEDIKEEDKKEDNSIIKEYVEDEIKETPALKEIEKELKEAKSVIEVVNMVKSFRENKDDLMEAEDFKAEKDNYIGKHRL